MNDKAWRKFYICQQTIANRINELMFLDMKMDDGWADDEMNFLESAKNR